MSSDKKAQKAEKWEAKARRARAEAAAVHDRKVWCALRMHDLACELAEALDKADDAGGMAHAFVDTTADLLEKLGAPL